MVKENCKGLVRPVFPSFRPLGYNLVSNPAGYLLQMVELGLAGADAIWEAVGR